jgi:hypothetical protein
MPLILAVCLLIFAPRPAAAQDPQPGRDTIPRALRQPQRGEAPRYPRDLVIGSLGPGNAPAAARRSALEIMSALSAGNQDAPSLASLGPAARGELFDSLAEIQPRAYRVGEGREEADGSCSFLVRFLGREMGIAGELYLRFRPPQPAVAEAVEPVEAVEPAGAAEPIEPAESEEPVPAPPPEGWVLDDLLLEEKRGLGEIAEEPLFDLPPYERLY